MPSRTRRYDVYQLKLTVHEIRPAIWRRILVRSDTTLARLHLVIQVLMGWYDYHLYQFRIANEPHGPPRDDDADYGYRKSVKVSIATAFAKGLDTIIYEYDFGDGWEIGIRLEKKIPERIQRERAICTGGARHGPMEDSGGPHGYQEMLGILRNPHHEEHDEIEQWIGSNFDPEGFNIDFENRLLRELDRSHGNPNVLTIFWEMRHNKSLKPTP